LQREEVESPITFLQSGVVRSAPGKKKRVYRDVCGREKRRIGFTWRFPNQLGSNHLTKGGEKGIGQKKTGKKREGESRKFKKDLPNQICYSITEKKGCLGGHA